MSVKFTLRWAVVYRALTTVAAVVGLGLVFAGFAVGLTVYPNELLDGNLGEFLGGDSPVAGLLVALVGIVAWRVGKAAAFYYTLTSAVEERMAERFDTERVKSDILAVLDDRLAGMEEQVGATRREVHEMAESQSGNEFQFEGGQ